MTVITSKYKSDEARLFVEDVAYNDYYLFTSSISNTTVENTAVSKRSFLEKTIFGKKLLSENVFYVIKNNVWQTGEAYAQYDDAADLEDKKYYTVVYPQDNTTGDYKIYKCLFNNYSSLSTSPPNYQTTTPDQIYIMPDGYIWKYMYSLTVSEFNKYNTRGYIPIIEPSVAANTVISSTSTVDQVFVTNKDQNAGYENVIGTIFQVLRAPVNTITLTPNAGSGLNGIANYYSGYSFYVTNQNTRSQVYEINTYSFNATTGRATITLVEGTPLDSILVDAADFNILPRVEIKGDGSGAIAIPSVNTSGSIVSVTVLNKGSNYTHATAVVVDPFAFNPSATGSLDTRVILRPVLSPEGGHGTNISDELSSTRVLAYTELDAVDNTFIPYTNSYSSIGIVKNPEFKEVTYPTIFDNRIELAVDTNPLAVNETVTQIETANTNSDFFNNTRFSAKVHAVSGDYVYLAEYSGPYPNDQGTYANTDFSDISLDINLPLISSKSQLIAINTDNSPAYTGNYDSTYPGFKLSPYVQRTGEVYYMHSFRPITRTASSREQFKIVLEF
tara:strand:+ start:12233 stop:13906 length:1674 start_codon:yes stop_codon:yes gene_type:complete